MPDPDTRPRWAAHRSHGAELTIQDDASASQMAVTFYLRELLSAGYRAARSAGWPTSATVDTLAELEGLAYLGRYGGDSVDAFYELEDAILRLTLEDGRVFTNIAAHTPERCDGLLADLRAKLLPQPIDPEKPQVPVTFWSLGSHGPVQRTRQIDVPPWEAVAPNYVAVTGGVLEPMMADFAPGVGGQLILWHGPPGTGKTYALRALAWEWRAWADLHYVTDPEVFFGDRAAYMLEVLLSSDGDQPAAPKAHDDGADTEADAPTPDPRAANGRWKLLVLEDTGELMSADARQRSGQGLSRLLNVVDGLIGQGLRVLALVTTNEQIKSLHEAVARPGRCAVNLEFAALPSREAADWLMEHAGFEDLEAEEAVGGRTITVADLFALREQRETTRERGREPAGFAR